MLPSLGYNRDMTGTSDLFTELAIDVTQDHPAYDADIMGEVQQDVPVIAVNMRGVVIVFIVWESTKSQHLSLLESGLELELVNRMLSKRGMQSAG